MTDEVVLTCDCGHSHTKHLPESVGTIFVVGECQECDCKVFDRPQEGRKA